MTSRSKPSFTPNGPPPARLLHHLARGLLLLLLLAHGRLSAENLPKGTITGVKVVGNTTLGEDEILRKLQCRVGRDLDSALIDADHKALLGTNWFSDVQITYEKDPEQAAGYVLTFRVSEAPVIRSIEYSGRKQIRLKALESATGLKVGARADHLRNMLAVAQIERLYQEKGYQFAEVKLLKGSKAEERDVVFEIFEGPKSKITGLSFTGNSFVSDATLRTKISSRSTILGWGGRYSDDDIAEDSRKLREYYQSMGFFEVKVSPMARPGKKVGEVTLEFAVWEGVQYKVRNISFDGNKLLPTDKLNEGLVMHSGKPFSDLLRAADSKLLEDRYGEIGCIDAMIEIERRYADPEKEPGVIDLVYHIREGEPYLLGDLVIRGNQRTRDRVLRREAEMAGLVPGEPLNAKRLEMYKKRLEGLRYFVTTPETGGKPIDIKIVNRRPSTQPYGEVAPIDIEEVIRARFQSPDVETLPDPLIVEPPPGLDSTAPGMAPGGIAPFSGGGTFDPPPDQGPIPPIAVPSAPVRVQTVPPAGRGVRVGQGALPPGDLPPLPIGSGEPPGMLPSLPGANMTSVGPDLSDPFPNRSYADIVTQVEEAPTGRLMFGVGATSYGGLSGNFILHESNFDITAVPRSWREITNGQAFRGGGQDFRIEISPGTLINRALVSFRDPYFLNLPRGFAVGLGLSGYAFSRDYQGMYTEGRAGGRFSLGSQFGTSTYADVALRVEDVRVSGFSMPAPADYLAVEGHTFLTTLRPSIRFDNRNDPYAPNKGQYLEAAFEQGWGDFTFPKFTMEGRKYFTLGSRPDGSGKRILTTRGYFGISGTDTPLYERFFAGDFRSMRGFSYRGVGPFILDRNVGGILSTIGSVEYQFPWLANDKLQQVVFCDFGTVESDYTFTTFRAAVGTGLRIYLPQQMFGPLPLAFDLAWPVAKGPDDRDRIFTFFIGAFW